MGFFDDPDRIPTSYGVKIAGGLIGFFMLMMLVDTLGLVQDLHHHVELRLFNLVILAVGIFYALKKFKTGHGEHLNYFRGLVVGVATGSTASTIFAAFMFLWMKLDSGLMQSIIDNEPMGHYLNPYISAFIVCLEGVFSAMLVTFVLLNYIGTDEVNDPAGESN